MCIHEFYLSTACGHHFPKLPPSAKPNVFFNNYHPTIAVPQSLTCAPVKLALKFYHDQVVYLPADMNCGGKVEIPNSCPIVHRPRNGPTRRTIREQERVKFLLDNAMLSNGLGPWQKWQIETNAAVLDQCSNRTKPGEHSPAALTRHKELQYPRNMYAHVQSVRAYQARDKRFMMPNVRYINVDFGCGGPFSGECLTGWDGVGLLTHRLHLWSDTVTHPKPCSRDCLAGWSGADLDTYRRQTWASDDLKNWRYIDYTKANKDVLMNSGHWVEIDYSNISHLHAEQFEWNGKRFERIHRLPSGDVVHVPETVLVPVPESLDQVLRGMSRVQPPRSPLPELDQASIEDLLGRLPEAFEEEERLSGKRLEPLVDTAKSSKSSSTLVDDPEPIPVETPEMAETRRQRARKEMREKIARDFSKGKGKKNYKEDNVSADAVNDRGQKTDNAISTDSLSVETIRATALPGSRTTAHTGIPPTKHAACNHPPSTLPPIQMPSPTAPLTALKRQLRDFQIQENHRLGLSNSDLDESNSSPINDIGDDLYATAEHERESAAFEG